MRILLSLFIILLLMIGCSKDGNFEEFDNRELTKELKEEGVNPKLPTKFPFKISKYERLIPPHDSNRYEIIFTGEDREIFSVIINSKAVEYNGEFEKEEIMINGNSGFYIESKLPGPSLHWTDGDYHYILDYQKGNLETELTKEMMIEIAESFSVRK